MRWTNSLSGVRRIHGIIVRCSNVLVELRVVELNNSMFFLNSKIDASRETETQTHSEQALQRGLVLERVDDLKYQVSKHKR